MYLDSFVKSKLTGNYHASRAVSILSQIQKGEFGMWNGILYTKECLEAEYWLAKHSAIKNFAAAQISIIELKKVGLTEKEAYDHFKKFQDAKLFTEDYSEFMEDHDDKTARFVKE
jgi:anaerobic ribonucleoside-triphosphate reductase